MDKRALTAMTVVELKALAKKKKTDLPSRALKADIIKALLAAEKKAVRAASKKSATAALKSTGKPAAPKKASTAKAKTVAAPKKPTKKVASTLKKTTVKTEASKKPVQQKPLPSVAASVVPAASNDKTPVREWKLPPEAEEPFMVQDRVAESKYYTGTGPAPQALVATYGELPQGYGDDNITLLTRDPFVAYAYWEASPERIEREKAWFGWDAKLCIRVYDITGVQFDGRNAIGYYDQEVFERAGNWYFDFGRPAHSFCADLGLLSPGGRFLTLVRSNYITMPRDNVSDSIDEDWALSEDDFWEIYGYPEVTRRGMSSSEMQEVLKRRKQMEVTSPGLFTRHQAKRK